MPGAFEVSVRVYVGFLASTKLDQIVSRRPVKQSSPKSSQGSWTNKGVMPAHRKLLVVVKSRQCHMCAPSLLFLPAQEALSACACVLCVSHLSVLLKAAPSLWQPA